MFLPAANDVITRSTAPVTRPTAFTTSGCIAGILRTTIAASAALAAAPTTASNERSGIASPAGTDEITATPVIARSAPTSPRPRKGSMPCAHASRNVRSGTAPMITEATPAGTRCVPQ